LLGDNGNDNNHSLIKARSCLANVIEQASDQQVQLEKIHATVKNWCQILFGDESLEKVFKQAGLNSGI
jgi:hypothetical protein